MKLSDAPACQYIKDLNQGRKPVVTGGPYPIPGAKLR